MLCLTEALRRLSTILICSAVTLALSTGLLAQTVSVGTHDIGGVVTSSKGPEAGVWVIAETTDLPTKFARIVVTDDQGRYLIPDLPSASYSVWVRGYGLVDSPKMTAKPGATLNHTATIASNEADAAHYYPAAYWYAMLKIPPGERFRRLNRHPQEHYPGQLAAPDEQRRLHRLSSAWPGIDPHDSRISRQV
jgi:hypothetical protein